MSEQINQEIEEIATDPVDGLLQEKKPASSGKGIAILALLLALVAVGGSGWQWWQAHRGQPAETTTRESIAQLEAALQQLSGSVDSIEARLQASGSAVAMTEFSSLRTQVQAVESQLDEIDVDTGEFQATMGALQGSVRSLEQRISVTESGLATVAASSQNSAVELDIAEIDFLLRIANERLQLFSDPAAADLALLAADVQIDALNDPLFLSVRQRIAAARQQLASVPRIDRVLLSAQLTNMQAKIPGLPFRGEVASVPESELPDDAGWWESLKHTLSSLVTVRRRVPEEQSLLSLEDRDYLRQGLWLQLESARLALMRNNAGVYDASLVRVSDTVGEYFETDDAPVQALLGQVAELQGVNVAPEMPDISAPWTQLRQLRDSRRLLQSAPPPESGVIDE